MAKEYDCEHCEHWVKDSFGDRVCEFDGDCENPAPQTNEEYLHSLNTEQLAEWISKVTIDAWFRQVNNELPKPNGAKEWAEWLKQPHEE
jgi:hypothetical protein